jgi:hypothetical protein
MFGCNVPEKIKRALGVVDGVNREFYSPSYYGPGSIRVFVDGVMIGENDTEAWEERGGKLVELREAPLPGSVVWFRFLQL